MVTYLAGVAHAHELFLHAGHALFGRYMLFAEREDEILPSFWGSNAIMLVAGTVLYGVLFAVLGATLLQGLLCLWLFNIMIVNWNGMSYLTAIKRLPRYPVQLCGCHWCGVPVRPGRAGTEGCRRSRACWRQSP